VKAGSRFDLRASGSTLKFDGYRKVYFDNVEEKESHIPAGLKENEALDLLKVETEQHFTKPPAPFTESSLVKVLDKEGIGRPSTYASIISVIQSRQYVKSEKRKLFPTELGKVTSRVLVDNFAELMNKSFTRDLEEQLDQVEEGKLSYIGIMGDFWSHLEKWLEESSDAYSEIKKSLQQDTDQVCEKCGKPMVIKWSKNGQFMACTGFPSCKNARPLESADAAGGSEEEGDTDYGLCDTCNSPLVLRTGRYGKFYACSTFPKCKFTKPFNILMPCPLPDCKGDISLRRSRRGRVFYGCTKYPDCNFSSWDPPVDHKCPQCEHPFMVTKSTKKKGDFVLCPECKHEIILKESIDSEENN
jgi:DNA topoisomerase-1